MPELPELPELRALAALLRRDNYFDLQFVPFADHTAEFVERHLDVLLAEEGRLLAARAESQPILYGYSLCRRHYQRALGRRQRVLADLFLYNHSLPIGTVGREAPEYERFLTVGADGRASWSFRLVPVFDLLLLADPIDCTDDRRVFLHNDSIEMARFLHRWPDCRNRVVADVGTGSGLLAAVLHSQGAARVIAADINPRAIAFARASFAINGCDRITAREGSIADVIDEADLIVSNPPYMVGRTAVCLAGGGDDGLDIPRDFVRRAAERGRRLVLVIEGYDGDVQARLGGQVSGAFVLRSFVGRQLVVYDFAPPHA